MSGESDPERPSAVAAELLALAVGTAERLLRLALLEAPTLEALLASVAALSDDEAREVLIELGFDALWQRHHGTGPG